MSSLKLFVALAFFLSSKLVHAHCIMWHEAMFGFNYPWQSTNETQNYDNQEPINPLRQEDNLTTAEWFGHGLLDFPPRPGVYMELESGGILNAEIASSRHFTQWRNPTWTVETNPWIEYCSDQIGPLHTINVFGQEPNISYFGGTALAIAYTSDETTLNPEDMVVISVNYSSVWWREVVYQIPPGMPPCPDGGCRCTWNWIHEAGKGEGYGPEIYNAMYKCNITGQVQPGNTLGKPKVPTLCENNPQNCTTGPKTPMYLYQKDGNNIVADDNLEWHNPPTHNGRYGFADGPQCDIFANGIKTCSNSMTNPVPYTSNNTAPGDSLNPDNSTSTSAVSAISASSGTPITGGPTSTRSGKGESSHSESASPDSGSGGPASGSVSELAAASATTSVPASASVSATSAPASSYTVPGDDLIAASGGSVSASATPSSPGTCKGKRRRSF